MNASNYSGWPERGQSETTRLTVAQRAQSKTGAAPLTIPPDKSEGRLTEWSEDHPFIILFLAAVSVFGVLIAFLS